MPVVSDYTALLSGSYWGGIEATGRPAIVTFSFPTSPEAYLAGIDGFTAATVASFQAFSAAQQAQARAALAEWAAASGLVFIEVAPGQGDLNFQLADLDTTTFYGGAGGVAFYPFGDWNYWSYPYFSGESLSSGDVFMNSQFVDGGTGELNYGTLLHEIGHAIGLRHPTEVVYNYASGVNHDQVLSGDDPDRTIMATVGGSGPVGLHQLDRDAAAFIYGGAGTGGVHTGSASGANSVVSSWSWNAATATLSQMGFAGDDAIRGSTVKDVIDGLGGNDSLFGLSGDDVLNGGAGADKLFGGTGADIMTGGADDDTYYVDDAGDLAIETAGGGYDGVIATISHDLAGEVEQLQLLGAGLTGQGNGLANAMFGDGSGATSLYGMGGGDYLVGGGAGDLLDGGTDADLLIGLGGGDTYVIDNTGDVVDETAPGSGGDDTVSATVSVDLADGDPFKGDIERVTLLAGFTGLNAYGNGLANALTGNATRNILDGRGGADVLRGLGGDDIYYLDNAGDVVDETGAGSGGNDQVFAGVSVNLADTVHFKGTIERVTLLDGITGLNLTGNAAANVLIGNNVGNTLDGGAGADTMRGMNGFDIYIVDNLADLVDESVAGSGGTDTVRASVSVDLNDTARFKGAIERIVLQDGFTRLNATGNALANLVTGNNVGNTLNGKGGNDTLTGGAGTDKFVFDTALGSGNVDRITDFSVKDDTIQLDDAVFTLLGATGTLAASLFKNTASGAIDADDRIVYNHLTGALSYDTNGSAGGGATQFATLSTGLALTNADFVVI